MDEERDEGVGELDDFQLWRVDASKGPALTIEAEKHERTTVTSGGSSSDRPRLGSWVGWGESSDRDHKPFPRGQGSTYTYILTSPPTHTLDLRSAQREGNNHMCVD